MAVAGEPLRMGFDRRRIFHLSFRGDPAVRAPTEIFVPEVQYPGGYRVEASDGDWESGDDPQVLLYRVAAGAAVHSIRICPS